MDPLFFVWKDVVALSHCLPKGTIRDEFWTIEEWPSTCDAWVCRLVLVLKLVDTHASWPKQAIALHLSDIELFNSGISQAEIAERCQFHFLSAFQQVEGPYVPIAEDVEAHDAALNGEQVQIGQPLFIEEHLWVVKIAVQSDAQEEKERGDVDLVIPSSSIVM